MKSVNGIAAELPGRGRWTAVSDPAPEPLGGELKVMFGALTSGPLPDRMVQLADALEEAFRRGELFDSSRRIS